MTAVRVRDAQLADVPLVLELIRALAEYEHLQSECVIREADLAAHLFGERRYAEALIGEIDGTAQGFALYFHNYSTFAGKPGIWLEDLFVRPEVRGSGLGRALLTEVAKRAVARDCARLEWSVLDWNAPAIAFYAKIGAQPKSEWIINRMSGAALRQFAAGS